MGLIDLPKNCSMKSLLQQYTAYNVWANTKFALLLKEMDSAVLDQEVISSFPSLRKTVNHIWDAELIWLSRMKNQVIAWPPTAQFKDPGIADFLNGSKAFDEFVRLEDDDFLKGSTTYKNSKGEEFTNPNSGIILHCMNHSTFHRGQLVTMLRTLGHTRIPSTDLIAFLRA
jgi:uncharacterized damage-inducible protein DinB